MPANGTDQPQVCRLRFVFDDTVVTRGVCANATFEDIARSLGRLSKRRYGNPLAIYATFGPALPAAYLL